PLEVARLPASLRSIVTVEAVGQPVAVERESESPLMSYEEEIRRFKRNLIIRTLREYGWRKAESARALGVARGYLHRLIHQLEIQEEDTDVPEKEPHTAPPLEPIM